MEENIQDIKRNLEEINLKISNKKLEDKLYVVFKIMDIEESLQSIEEYINEYY